MLERFKDVIKKDKSLLKPRHIAITTSGIEKYSKDKLMNIDAVQKQSFNLIKDFIKEQVKESIPIITFYLIPQYMKKDTDYFVFLVNATVDFLNEIIASKLIIGNKIKISFLGKWYDLPQNLVDAIKKAIDITKDYDNFFVNFCINYNGQEEIVDACKLIARQVKAEKLDVDAINKDVIKENLYSSYFLPPDLLIINGLKKQTNGILLWDSIYSRIVFTEKLFPEFSVKDFDKAIKEFEKS